MRFLLDTDVVIWWLSRSSRLGQPTLDNLISAQEVWVSAISAVEIAIKKSLGKLRTPDDLEARMEMNSFRPLEVTFEHAGVLQGLPFHHRDPFDRILIAQAISLGLTIVTSDPMISRYDVPVLAV